MEHRRYVVHVFEGQYGGSSGIEEYYFTKLDDLKDVEDEAITASVNLMMSYSFIADTLEDEEVDIFENVAYTIYEILDYCQLSDEDIENMISQDPEQFIEDYCEIVVGRG